MFDVLKRHLARYPQVVLHEVALSDQSAASVQFHVPILMGSLPEPALASVEALSGPQTTITIRLQKLDEYADQFDACHFIKVDVEGHEASFLAGALRVIEHHRPLIQIESNDLARDAAFLEEFAQPRRYSLCRLDADGTLHPANVEEPGKDYNFYLVPEGWTPR